VASELANAVYKVALPCVSELCGILSVAAFDWEEGGVGYVAWFIWAVDVG